MSLRLVAALVLLALPQAGRAGVCPTRPADAWLAEADLVAVVQRVEASSARLAYRVLRLVKTPPGLQEGAVLSVVPAPPPDDPCAPWNELASAREVYPDAAWLSFFRWDADAQALVPIGFTARVMEPAPARPHPQTAGQSWVMARRWPQKRIGRPAALPVTYADPRGQPICEPGAAEYAWFTLEDFAAAGGRGPAPKPVPDELPGCRDTFRVGETLRVTGPVNLSRLDPRFAYLEAQAEQCRRAPEVRDGVHVERVVLRDGRAWLEARPLREVTPEVTRCLRRALEKLRYPREEAPGPGGPRMPDAEVDLRYEFAGPKP